MNLLSVFKSPDIEFLCDPEHFGVIPEPVHASKCMPEWFKKVSAKPIIGKRDDFGKHGMTAKHCLPLVDGMSTGFVIKLAGDVNIRSSKDGKNIGASVNKGLGELIQFHNVDQLGGATSPTYPGPAIKFINPWIIRTPPGYSVLITPCLNHIEPRFTILSAVVDTDKYFNMINFPAIWNMKDFDGVIEAGTPIATVIPFKRSDMPKSAKVRSLSKSEKQRWVIQDKKQQTRGHVYTREQREKR